MSAEHSNPIRPERWRWVAIAIFALATAVLFKDVLAAGLAQAVPLFPRYDDPDSLSMQQRFWMQARQGDLLFVVWLVSRNAVTLLLNPTALFDSEICFPAPDMLALGEPMITLGILGIPGAIVSGGDPVFTYNISLIAMTLLSATGIYLLVRDWTGLPQAGIVAGLLYTFAHVKVWDVTHPYVGDTVWTLFAIYFVRRFFASGRWRDAILTALACGLQFGGSLYAVLSAAVLALPILIWLFKAHGISKLRVGPTLAGLAVLLAIAFLIYSPYLSAHGAAELTTRSLQHFEQPASFLPGGARFVGWFALLLIAAALALGRNRALAGLHGDPRWALLAAGLLCAMVSMGPHNPGFNLYGLLMHGVPGLDSVRNPATVGSGVHLAASVLAGLGAASLLRALPDQAPRLRPDLVAAALIAMALFTTSGSGLIGDESGVIYQAFQARPAQSELDFFATLEEAGNRGAVFEVPVANRAKGPRAWRIMRSGYHRRPTSACYNSYLPTQFGEILELGEQFPEPAAISRMRELGFTTVIAHHSPETQIYVYDPSAADRLAAQSDAPIERIHGDRSMTAYAIK